MLISIQEVCKSFQRTDFEYVVPFADSYANANNVSKTATRIGLRVNINKPFLLIYKIKYTFLSINLLPVEEVLFKKKAVQIPLPITISSQSIAFAG